MGGRGALAGVAAGAALFAGLLYAGFPSLAYTAFFAAFVLFCLTTRLSLSSQIVIGVVLGCAFGAVEELHVESTLIVGRLFIAALKMMIAPMITLAIIQGIAGMGAARDVGRMGALTVGLYTATMAFAVATGLIFVNVFEPGAGTNLAETEFFAQAVTRDTVATAIEPSAILFEIVRNPIAAIAEGRILPIVFFSLLFGIALLQAGARAKPLVDVLGTAYQAIMRIIGWFMRLAPLGIFALLGHLVATLGFQKLIENLGVFAAVVIAATAVHAGITLPVFARVLAGIRPGALFRALREPLVVAFSTSSSAATLPVTTRCVEDELGVPRSVSSFVLPLGATVNMDGTALYEAIAALFVANVYGVELGLDTQLLVFAMAMIMAMGAPGIPSAGMVTMIVVLEAVGLPGEAVGILITIDRFLDTFRTMANVEGDAIVAACVTAGLSGSVGASEGRADGP